MEMEINVINNKIFTELYLKLRVRKINFITYHFLVKRKPHEKIDLLITEKSIPIVMKTCFSKGKLMKQFGNPPLSKKSPLSTNPPISEQYFHDPHLCPNFKNEKPP